MSYCRFSNADVYVYADVGGYLNCCACPLRGESQRFYSTDAMIVHLGEHVAAGDDVPQDVFDELEADRAENDAWMADVAAASRDKRPFVCDTCQDEGVILVPDEREAPTYESGPYAVETNCPDCAAASDEERPA